MIAREIEHGAGQQTMRQSCSTIVELPFRTAFCVLRFAAGPQKATSAGKSKESDTSPQRVIARERAKYERSASYYELARLKHQK
jgi:hypothetical protein